ncbi:MAG TPA: hypothetical protein VFF73_37360, partial [Planctomycetota bacterium]|nr:hypothetical protein [Planctomycetota bacterium]
MKRLAHPEWLARLEAAIAAAESTSEGEIVVVVERASDRYREVDLGLAAAFAALVLLGLVFAPWFEVHHALVLPLLVLVHLTALALVPRIGLLRRIFTSRARRARAVREAARLAFFDEYVAASPARTSVLLYAS